MPILVGTASWTDKTLLACGRFYPADATSAEGRLRYYARQFPIAEVDSSFYALPTAANAHLWATRTPDAYTFNVKAFRLFTGHRTPLTALDADLRHALGDWPEPAFYVDQAPVELREELWRRFVLALEPLRMTGKLGAVHFQFAPWVRRDRRGMARVEDCVRHLEDHVASIEFRHRSWFDGAAAADTLAFLRRLNAAHTVIDAPQGFDNTVPPVWETTRADLALVRLHGRNAATWAGGGDASSSRFTYEYSPAELAELARRVRELARRAQRTHVIVNTNYEDQGMRNAQGLMSALLQEADR